MRAMTPALLGGHYVPRLVGGWPEIVGQFGTRSDMRSVTASIWTIEPM